jgi:type IV secretion system protein VirB10
MDANQPPHVPEPSPVSDRARPTIRDRRLVPSGTLPRQAQTWIMVGLAVLILGVILMTGQPEPARSTPVPASASPAGVIAPARVQSYQERLAEQEARLRRDVVAAAPAPSLGPVDVVVPAPPAPVDPAVDERRRREEQSLFADNVAFTRRVNGSTERAEDGQRQDSPATASPSTGPATSVTARPEAAVPQEGGSAGAPATERQETLTEGTVVETVLVNRLDGTFQGPVDCVVTTPVYSRSRQVVVIPAGARVLGTAAAVQSWGESRLAVRFHRLVFPDGRTFRLDSFPGLNQVGETGLKDAVDRHYFQVFGASLAIGAISGLAQVGTRGGFDPSFGDAARQSAGSSLATSTARVLDRYLNVLPTVTIHEGHRIKVVLTGDLQLPAYGPTAVQGGV